MLKAYFSIQHTAYEADLSRPLDISMAFLPDYEGVNCFWAPAAEYTPVRMGDFIGSVEAGAPVNFFNVKINPHGNGTHTECVGHISPRHERLGDCMKESVFAAQLISVYPEKTGEGDRVVFRRHIEDVLFPGTVKALVLRTMPNTAQKCHTEYSGTNPPYLSAEAMQYIVECGIEHLLVDLPSVDREEDGGALAAHKIFWDFPGDSRRHCTITELIYVSDRIKDGYYLLNIQTAPLALDACPSRPVLYAAQAV